MSSIGQPSPVEAWTRDRPDPDHGIETPGLLRVRRAVEEALRSGPAPILLWGPPGHGKTLLLRSLWAAPPAGFSSLFVPFANVEPQRLAAWIVSTMRRSPAANPRAALNRLLRAHTLRGTRPLLLVDEVQAMPRATLAKLFELVAASGLDVRVVAAGFESHTLDDVPGVPRHSVRKIAVADTWTRVEVVRLLSQVAADAAVPVQELLAGIDVDEVVRVGEGNPRRTRRLLAARLERLEQPAWVEAVAAARQADGGVIARATAHARQAAAIACDLLAKVALRGGPAAVSLAAGVRGLTARARARARPAAAAVRAALARARVHLVEYAIRTGALAVAGRPRLVRLLARMGERIRPPPARAPAARATAVVGSLAAAAALLSWLVPGPAEDAPPIALPSEGEAVAAPAPDVAAPPREAADPAPRETVARETWATEVAEATEVATAPERIPIRVNSYPWSHVEIDGEPVGSTPLTVALEPGSHRFRLVMADGRVREEVVVISPERDHVAFR